MKKNIYIILVFIITIILSSCSGIEWNYVGDQTDKVKDRVKEINAAINEKSADKLLLIFSDEYENSLSLSDDDKKSFDSLCAVLPWLKEAADAGADFGKSVIEFKDAAISMDGTYANVYTVFKENNVQYEICFEMKRPEDDSGNPSEFWYIARVYLK